MRSFRTRKKCPRAGSEIYFRFKVLLEIQGLFIGILRLLATVGNKNREEKRNERGRKEAIKKNNKKAKCASKLKARGHVPRGTSCRTNICRRKQECDNTLQRGGCIGGELWRDAVISRSTTRVPSRTEPPMLFGLDIATKRLRSSLEIRCQSSHVHSSLH